LVVEFNRRSKVAQYFVQHGVALSKEQDSDRPLSSEGRHDVIAMAKHLRQVGVVLNTICHSGKTRARQTAELFAEQLGVGNVVEVAGMGPNDDVAVFAKTLKGDDVMYIGHLPHIGKLVSYLVTKDAASEVVKFNNAAVVCLEQGLEKFYLKWFIRPDLLNS
jgi:phosphohistidine phosphatase